MIAKTGRPRGPAPLPTDKRRGVQITVSFRPHEIALVDTRRPTADMPRAVWIRECALAEAGIIALRPVVVTPLNATAWGELARSAANLNQIARHLNGLNEDLDIEEIQAALRRFRTHLITPQAGS